MTLTRLEASRGVCCENGTWPEKVQRAEHLVGRPPCARPRREGRVILPTPRRQTCAEPPTPRRQTCIAPLRRGFFLCPEHDRQLGGASPGSGRQGCKSR